jgi:hypothetical protein
MDAGSIPAASTKPLPSGLRQRESPSGGWPRGQPQLLSRGELLKCFDEDLQLHARYGDRAANPCCEQLAVDVHPCRQLLRPEQSARARDQPLCSFAGHAINLLRHDHGPCGKNSRPSVNSRKNRARPPSCGAEARRGRPACSDRTTKKSDGGDLPDCPIVEESGCDY